ncbi:ABC transporter permease [Agitococcus lubricus]|uniref:ABC-type polysaccharide/polyol phosphate export permease n=1 Tax=Agitococcus lubricus TaxID=1077255 RepID=A0A2T5J0X8_9GAMM|nr:ABC transporter permease [Agitococcus lubricus]PTQ90045.1 ABC-type polysaccharide/polyol phosphate export permease [Agitococcus lubricus]
MLVNRYDLFINLFRKELKIRYMGSWLGVIWSLLPPTLFAIFYTFLFTYILPLKDRANPLLVVTGYLHWYFFAQVVSQGCDILISNSWLMKKVDIPKIFINISTFCVTFFFWVLIIFFYLLYIFFNFGFSLFVIYYLLFVVLYVSFCFSISVILSFLYVSFRDLRYITDVLLQALFWLSPVVYNWRSVPELFSNFYYFNPVAIFIVIFQEMLTSSAPFDKPIYFILAIGYTILVGLIAYFIYQTKKDTVVEVI